ncbi:hypothetical protein LTR33_016048 [Friedmanniomyces endolithicus]|nr:hypothetical protein LTR33_016048 [Friedmanniomyces endolithicus]
MGVNTNVNPTPTNPNNAHNNAFWPNDSRSTNLNKIKNGQLSANPLGPEKGGDDEGEKDEAGAYRGPVEGVAHKEGEDRVEGCEEGGLH